MKYPYLPVVLFLFFACNNADDATLRQNRIDSLQQKTAATYKPGFGEFMLAIQAHHSKLWFAGKNNNWRLADFEMNEIGELVEDIRKYETDRTETEKIIMIQPAIDSVNNAIQSKDQKRFKSSFTLLTNTCNNCHHAVNFEFNVVKIPETSPFTNQDFSVKDTAH
jgi:hypothetical protein